MVDLPKFLLRSEAIADASELQLDDSVSYRPREPLIPQTAPRRRRSEAAAHAAEQWEDLENERNSFKLGLDSANAHISVLEESNTLLHESLDQLQSQLEYHQRRCIRLLTFIEQIGLIASGAALDVEPPLITKAIDAAQNDQKDQANVNEAQTKLDQDPSASTLPSTERSKGGPSPSEDRSGPA